MVNNYTNINKQQFVTSENVFTLSIISPFTRGNQSINCTATICSKMIYCM